MPWYSASALLDQHSEQVWQEIGASRAFCGVPESSNPAKPRVYKRRKSDAERAEYFTLYHQNNRKDACECGRLKCKSSKRCASCAAIENNRRRWGNRED